MAIKVIGGQRELHPKHLFIVDIDGFDDLGFQKCSELSYETAKIEYWEGGSNIPWKVPGRVTMTDVTLERGTSSDYEFYNWAVAAARASVGQFPTRGDGLILSDSPGGDWRRDATIIQLDRDADSEVRGWDLKNAWVQKFVAGDWDNTADEVVIEQLTLTFDFFSVNPDAPQ